MAVFDDMFKFYEKEFGKEVIINNEEEARVAYIQDNSLKSSFFNDKTIFCEHEIKTGDVITYQGEKWIIITQSDKYKTYNVATMRQADFVTKFVFYGSVYEAPCIYMNQSFTSKNSQVSLTDSKTVCLVPHYDWVDNIKVGDMFIQFGYFWKVTGFDFTKEGIVYVYAERDKEADYESIQKGYDKNAQLYDWIIKWKTLPATVIAGHSYPIEAQLIKIFDNGYTEPATEPFFYETSDKNMAIIADNELVAKKAGKVTITGIFTKDLTKKISREIEIYPSNDKLNLVFDPFPDTMYTEDKYTISAKLYKNGVLQNTPNIKYFIPDNYSEIAEIDELHKITALKAGQFFVYATYEDQYNELTITKAVNVTQSVYTVSFETQSRLYQIGSRRSCKANIYRNNVIDMEKVVEYESSNTQVASISNDGVISAETLGNAVITAYMLGNRDVKISKPIEVVEDAYEVIWDKYLSGRLYLDKTYQCHAIITKNYEPLPASENLEVAYLSSDNRVITVDEQGTVTVLSEGKATITAYIKTKPTIKATSDVYIDKAFYELKIVQAGSSSESDFNEKKIYWGSTEAKTNAPKDVVERFDVTVWKGFNIVVTRDGEVVTPDFLAKDCIKIFVDGRDYTSAYFNEADLLHAEAYRVLENDTYKYYAYDYKKDRRRQTMKLNEFDFSKKGTDYFHLYKVVVTLPNHPEVESKEIEWTIIPAMGASSGYHSTIDYYLPDGQLVTSEIEYPIADDFSTTLRAGEARVLKATTERVEVEQMQLSGDNISFISNDRYESIIKRDLEMSWKDGEYGLNAFNKPTDERFDTKNFDGKTLYFHDRNGMLTDTGYVKCEVYLRDINYWESPYIPKYIPRDKYACEIPEHIKEWLKRYKAYMPFNRVSTNDDTVISAEFTQSNWNYLRGVGIGTAIITTEYGFVKEEDCVQDVNRFQTSSNCVRTTGLGLYLTSNKIIPVKRMMGIGAYATLNSKLLPSEDMVFEIYDNGGNDVELYNVPLIKEGGLLENGEPRQIPFKDGWREDPVYAARNPVEITSVRNTSPYVEIDNNGDIVWNYSMRFIYIKNDTPVGDVYIKAYNKNYPNNYVIRRLYVSEYLSPVGRIKMWLGFKKDDSDDLPRYGITELPVNFVYDSDYYSTGSIEWEYTEGTEYGRLTCDTYRLWKKSLDSMLKLNYPYDYRYMSIFLYDQSQPNNLIKPEDKYDIGFWRWGFDYNGYGGYSTYTGDGIGAKVYNNQLIIDLRSWFQYLKTWQPFYIVLQNCAMGIDGFKSSLSNYNYMDDSMFDYSTPTGNYVLGSATRSEVIKSGFEGTLDEAMKNLAISRAYNEYERKYSTTGEDAYQWSSIGYTKLWFQNLPEPTYKYLMIINNTPTPFNLHQWYLALYADWFNKKNGDYNYTYGAGAVGYGESFDYSKEYNSPLEIIANRKFEIDPNNLFDNAYNKYIHTAFAIKHVSSLELVGRGDQYIGGYIYADDSNVITPF